MAVMRITSARSPDRAGVGAARRTGIVPACPPALALSLTGLGCSAQSAKYIVDPTHTFVMYEIGHFGTTTKRGRLSTTGGSKVTQVSGSLTLEGKTNPVTLVAKRFNCYSSTPSSSMSVR